MKSSFIIGIIALFMSAVLVSCSDGFSNDADLKKTTPPTTDPSTPTPDPEKPKADTTNWGSCVGKAFKVYADATVRTWMYSHRGGKDQETILDSLVLRYNYVYSLKSDTTIYLKNAPTQGLSFTSNSEGTTEYSEYSKNEQGDSVCTIRYEKPYTLSNGVPLSLKTERVRGWHTMGGRPELYSEPYQTVGRMTISSETTEFERNDSIFGVRTNVCSVPLTLGGVSFSASATVKEIWFKALKDGPEPSYNVTLPEFAKYICASKCKVSLNNWKDCFLFEGQSKFYVVVAHLDKDGNIATSYEVKSINKNRVAYGSGVAGVIYDTQTSSYIPAQIMLDYKDNNGWYSSGEIDGRVVTYDPQNALAIEEGVKNFVDSGTSVPSPFFRSVNTSAKTWKEFSYTSITWSKYAKKTELRTQILVVKMPAK